jgi:hypothetical protein
MDQFTSVLETLDMSFTDAQLHYLRLLFYSHSQELRAVPYKQFIEAYGTLTNSEMASGAEEEDDDSFESVTSKEYDRIVEGALRRIAKAL